MRRSAIAMLGCLLLSAASAHALDVVGKAAAVRLVVKGTPPGQAERTVPSGGDLFGKERIVVSPEGDLQVLFRDETTLSIGPGSDMVLDEFVFDPARTDKALSVKLRRGVARLIGGKITKDAGASVGTSNATIAIRGGIMIVSAPSEGDGTTRGLLALGTMTCLSGTETVTITDPGMMCVVGQDIRTRRATQREIGQLLASLVGTGPIDRPIDGDVVSKSLEIDCGGEAALNDPRCIAEKGFAGVDPEPLGAPQPRDLIDQLQDPRGTLPSPPGVAEKICAACLDR